eukprot:TRINITY_DN14566_c0_g1_i1.p1 TRINITY_DN14566_c0_g1~~TRINITY_DN14566_c0_g1_i1.p1  ORF type:complete len:389 (-),score=89.85 TRINITY_DN14566_c0_g1_i1:299-1465(-)
MPVYEEKLICPLAVRFTQEHIRPKFKDGHMLEETINQIKTEPGKDGYDVVLKAPFPSIEIIRWSQFDTEATEAHANHWFTLDNRRLYCLQRVAASLWPKKCVAHVEVLYATCHGIKRKDTSGTVGRDVAIRHSDKDTEAGHWDWRAAVEAGLETGLRRALRGITEEDIRMAYNFVVCEDEKASTEELSEAPEALSLLNVADVERAVSFSGTSTEEGSSAAENASTPTSSRGTPVVDDSQETLAALKAKLEGTWAGKRAETYEVMDSGKPATWKCIVRRGAHGASKTYTLWYDEESNCISWGLDWSYFADASEFLENSTCVQWYGKFAKRNKPDFIWRCMTEHSKTSALDTSIDQAWTEPAEKPSVEHSKAAELTDWKVKSKTRWTPKA